MDYTYILILYVFYVYREVCLIECFVCWQLGCGGVTVDLLAAVEAYPKPDDKIRSTSLKVIKLFSP